LINSAFVGFSINKKVRIGELRNIEKTRALIKI